MASQHKKQIFRLQQYAIMHLHNLDELEHRFKLKDQFLMKTIFICLFSVCLTLLAFSPAIAEDCDETCAAKLYKNASFSEVAAANIQIAVQLEKEGLRNAAQLVFWTDQEFLEKLPLSLEQEVDSIKLLVHSTSTNTKDVVQSLNRYGSPASDSFTSSITPLKKAALFKFLANSIASGILNYLDLLDKSKLIPVLQAENKTHDIVWKAYKNELHSKFEDSLLMSTLEAAEFVVQHAAIYSNSHKLLIRIKDY